MNFERKFEPAAGANAYQPIKIGETWSVAVKVHVGDKTYDGTGNMVLIEPTKSAKWGLGISFVVSAVFLGISSFA